MVGCGYTTVRGLARDFHNGGGCRPPGSSWWVGPGPQTPREALYLRTVGHPTSLSLPPQMYPGSGLQGVGSH